MSCSTLDAELKTEAKRHVEAREEIAKLNQQLSEMIKNNEELEEAKSELQQKVRFMLR